MKGIIFLDTEFKQVNEPEFNSVDDWDQFMMNVDYIFIGNSKSLESFNDLRHTFEKGKTPFVAPGPYTWDTVKEEWVNAYVEYYKWKSLVYKLGQLYSMQAKLPLEGIEE